MDFFLEMYVYYPMLILAYLLTNWLSTFSFSLSRCFVLTVIVFIYTIIKKILKAFILTEQ